MGKPHRLACWAYLLYKESHEWTAGAGHLSYYPFSPGHIFIPPTVSVSLQQREPVRHPPATEHRCGELSFLITCTGMLLVTALLAEKLHTMRELNASEWEYKWITSNDNCNTLSNGSSLKSDLALHWQHLTFPLSFVLDQGEQLWRSPWSSEALCVIVTLI